MSDDDPTTDPLRRSTSFKAGASVSITAKVHRRLPADHPVQSLIGRVATEWAHFEHLLDELIWMLAKVDSHTGACLTGQMMGSFARLTAIYALCSRHELPKPVLAQITELMRKCRGAQDRRNRILHDAWYHGDEIENIEQFKAMARDDYLFGFHPIDESFIEETLAKMERRIDAVKALRNAISAAL